MPHLYEEFRLTQRGASDWSVVELTREHNDAWNGAHTFEQHTAQCDRDRRVRAEDRQKTAEFPVMRYLEVLCQMAQQSYDQNRVFFGWHGGIGAVRETMPQIKRVARQIVEREVADAKAKAIRETELARHQVKFDTRYREVLADLLRQHEETNRPWGVTPEEWGAAVHDVMPEIEIMATAIVEAEFKGKTRNGNLRAKTVVDVKATIGGKPVWFVGDDNDMFENIHKQETHEQRYASSSRPWDFKPRSGFNPFADQEPPIYYPNGRSERCRCAMNPHVDPTLEVPCARTAKPHWQQLKEKSNKRGKKK